MFVAALLLALGIIAAACGDDGDDGDESDEDAIVMSSRKWRQLLTTGISIGWRS